MGNLIAYSGIATKARTMERWRIKDEQFLETAALETIVDAVQYLRTFLSCREIFSQVKDRDPHRESIEQHLSLSQCGDFAKLYQFANIEQRCFLGLYFMHYEVTILKACLGNVTGHREQRQDLSMSHDFFGRYSALDLIMLPQSQGMEEFIGNLKESTYCGSLYQVLQNGKVTLPVCETALDMLHLRSMWRIKGKYLLRSEQRITVKCFGARVDILNLQWIRRSRGSYQLESGEIYAMLISIQLHLTRKEINRIVRAKDLDILYGLIGVSWYGKMGLVHLDGNQDLDHLAHDIINRIHQRVSRRDPYSTAILNSYLYFKEREVECIITTIEKIRYELGAS